MLTPEQWRLVNELFHRALDVGDGERAEWIERETRHLPTVKKELLSLLESYSQASEFLEQPACPGRLDTQLRKGLALPSSAAPLVSSLALSFAPGDRTGDFLILKTLGEGAFAKVYLAHQLSLDRQVALKVSINFGEEARTMAPLEHDNIVKVFSESVDTGRDLRVLCMQYVPGTTLERVLAELTREKAEPAKDLPIARNRHGHRSADVQGLDGARILSAIDRLNTADASLVPAALRDRELLSGYDYTEAVLWLGTQLADALEYAHGRDVLHLDVKPGNVLLTPYGRPMLTDFNVAVRCNDENSSEAVLGGTLNYMAPEHRRLFEQRKRKLPGNERSSSTAAPETGLRIDPRADIYSLGVVLREMTGLSPSTSPNREALTRIAGECTQAEPQRRFASAAALRDTLEGALELSAIRRALPPAGSITRMVERHSLLALLLLAVIPQLIGSVVNIAYNDILIVRHLSAVQQTLFKDLVLLYNGIVYPICLAWVFRELLPLGKCLRGGVVLCDGSLTEIDDLRARVLRLPARLVAIITLGWMPGSLFFPLSIHCQQGPVGHAVFENFFISFTLSWLVALSYSCLYVQYVALRVIYPRLWWRKRQIRRTAARELAASTAPLRLFQFMAAFIPLIGALLVVFVGPDDLSGRDYRVFQYLVTGLLILGMAGLVFALKVSQLISGTLYAFMGRE